MACSICGRPRCKIRWDTGRPNISKSLSLTKFKADLSTEARSIFNENTYCEQQRLAHLIKNEPALFTHTRGIFP